MMLVIKDNGSFYCPYCFSSVEEPDNKCSECNSNFLKSKVDKEDDYKKTENQ